MRVNKTAASSLAYSREIGPQSSLEMLILALPLLIVKNLVDLIVSLHHFSLATCYHYKTRS